MIARANRKMKEEMRKNNFKEEPTYYIDRDRAAATVAGSKDIKSELKVNCITGYPDISWYILMLQIVNIDLHTRYVRINVTEKE